MRRARSATGVELAALVSPDVGIVHRVDSGVTQWDHPRLAPAFAQLCDTRPVLGVSLTARSGGMAHDLPTARISAAGEAVERYSAASVAPSRLRLATPDAISGPVAEPDWTDRTSERPAVHWVPGHRLLPAGASQPAWVAASRAFLADVDHGVAAMHPTSTGLACHPDAWSALAAGLLEVIERDAIMMTWLRRAPAVPIATGLTWRTATGGDVRFDRAIESYRLFLLASPTEVPVVLGVALGGPGQPAAAVGAGTHPDLARACRRALIETHQTFQWAQHMLARGEQPPATVAEFADFDDHVAYYLNPERLPAFDFLLEQDCDPVEVDLDRVAQAPASDDLARTVIARIASAGFESFAVDVTSPDVRSVGLWVVRAVVPGMYPLIVGTAVRPDLERLPATTDVNPDPHPFP